MIETLTNTLMVDGFLSKQQKCLVLLMIFTLQSQDLHSHTHLLETSHTSITSFQTI